MCSSASLRSARRDLDEDMADLKDLERLLDEFEDPVVRDELDPADFGELSSSKTPSKPASAVRGDESSFSLPLAETRSARRMENHTANGRWTVTASAVASTDVQSTALARTSRKKRDLPRPDSPSTEIVLKCTSSSGSSVLIARRACELCRRIDAAEGDCLSRGLVCGLVATSESSSKTRFTAASTGAFPTHATRASSASEAPRPFDLGKATGGRANLPPTEPRRRGYSVRSVVDILRGDESSRRRGCSIETSRGTRFRSRPQNVSDGIDDRLWRRVPKTHPRTPHSTNAQQSRRRPLPAPVGRRRSRLDHLRQAKDFDGCREAFGLDRFERMEAAESLLRRFARPSLHSFVDVDRVLARLGGGGHESRGEVDRRPHDRVLAPSRGPHEPAKPLADRHAAVALEAPPPQRPHDGEREPHRAPLVIFERVAPDAEERDGHDALVVDDKLPQHAAPIFDAEVDRREALLDPFQVAPLERVVQPPDHNEDGRDVALLRQVVLGRASSTLSRGAGRRGVGVDLSDRRDREMLQRLDLRLRP
mmetsp:Transcript_3291/g.9938  ORF Transcript_3291/g.9938 Transcript_3291/m.9938 type:complete len:537 (+) Transcript_3291:3353-4963(+)